EIEGASAVHTTASFAFLLLSATPAVLLPVHVVHVEPVACVVTETAADTVILAKVLHVQVPARLVQLVRHRHGLRVHAAPFAANLDRAKGTSQPVVQLRVEWLWHQ